MFLSWGVREDSWESLRLQGDPTSPSWRRSVLGVHWKDWCWSWNSSTLATWCEELTHLKRPWCWERLRAWEEGDDRGWDGWMASLTPWTWVWVDSGSWWWTGRLGVLQSMGSQRVGCDWATELHDDIRGFSCYGPWAKITWKHLPFLTSLTQMSHGDICWKRFQTTYGGYTVRETQTGSYGSLPTPVRPCNYRLPSQSVKFTEKNWSVLLFLACF